MNYFHSVKDSDIFSDPLPEPKQYIERPTVKGLVFDADNKIAILSRNPQFGLFPGGGVEDGETLEEAFKRECKEEIGCDVEIVSKIGTALQLRVKDERKFDTHFFLAKIIGEKGERTTTQESELSTQVRWLSLQEVADLLRNQIDRIPEEYYQSHFNSRTHLAAFEEYLKKISTES